MKPLFLALFLVALAPVANANYLVENGTVTAVTNTTGNDEQFAIRITGGTGTCNTGVWIVFKLVNAGTEKIYDRAYAAALTALALGRAVNVYDYHDTDSCSHAESIQIVG